jgi:hypothetical protein
MPIDFSRFLLALLFGPHSRAADLSSGFHGPRFVPFPPRRLL